MGIPLWRSPSPPPSDPVLSPSNSHRLAIRRRARDRRTRSSQTLFDLLRGSDSLSPSSSSPPLSSSPNMSGPGSNNNNRGSTPGDGENARSSENREHEPHPQTARERLSSQLLREITASPIIAPPGSGSERAGIWRRVRSPVPLGDVGASGSEERWRSGGSRLRSLPFRVPRYLHDPSVSSERADTGVAALRSARRLTAMERDRRLRDARDARDAREGRDAGSIIDGLGDRERSISPDEAAMQWELVASDISLAACDLWDNEDVEIHDLAFHTGPPPDLDLLLSLQDRRNEFDRMHSDLELVRERRAELERLRNERMREERERAQRAREELLRDQLDLRSELLRDERDMNERLSRMARRAEQARAGEVESSRL